MHEWFWGIGSNTTIDALKVVAMSDAIGVTATEPDNDCSDPRNEEETKTKCVCAAPLHVFRAGKRAQVSAALITFLHSAKARHERRVSRCPA